MQVTTSHNAGPTVRARARDLARRLSLTWRDRREVDWSEPVAVLTRRGLRVRVGGRDYGWHPGLLHARLEAGRSHPMIRAGGVSAGDRILDATLGLGTDAAFLAAMAGRPVVGIEAHPILALMVAEGVAAAGHPVHVVCARSDRIVPTLPSGSFDAVFCDPLFRPGRGYNASLQLYREVGASWRPDRAWVAEARRVARRAVVIKDERGGDLLEALGADEVFTPRRGATRYGRFVAEGR